MKTLIKKGGKLEEYIKIRNSKGLGNTLFSSVVLANGVGGGTRLFSTSLMHKLFELLFEQRTL